MAFSNFFFIIPTSLCCEENWFDFMTKLCNAEGWHQVRKGEAGRYGLYSMLTCYSTLCLIHFPYHVLSAASFLKLFSTSLPSDGAFSSRVVRHHQKICKHENLIQKSFPENLPITSKKCQYDSIFPTY